MTDTDQEAGPWIDVPKILNNDQVRSYLEDGYLVVPDLVGERELTDLKTDIVKLARGGRGGHRRVLQWAPAAPIAQEPQPQLPARSRQSLHECVVVVAVVPVAGADPYAWKGVVRPPRTLTMRRCKAHESVSIPS